MCFLSWHPSCSAICMTKDELQARTLAFASEIRHLCLRVRSQPDGRSVADQLLRCATSVGANYRSACRGRSRAEFIAKLGVVVEEGDEAVYWLELIEKSGLLVASDVADLLNEAKQLQAIFAASYGTARSNQRQRERKR